MLGTRVAFAAYLARISHQYGNGLATNRLDDLVNANHHRRDGSHTGSDPLPITVLSCPGSPGLTLPSTHSYGMRFERCGLAAFAHQVDQQQHNCGQAGYDEIRFDIVEYGEDSVHIMT